MWFLFVRPEICLHLPSDSTSRWTPLVFGYDLPATGRSRDFHPLECAHAERTSKSPFLYLERAFIIFRPGTGMLYAMPLDGQCGRDDLQARELIFARHISEFSLDSLLSILPGIDSRRCHTNRNIYFLPVTCYN